MRRNHDLSSRPPVVVGYYGMDNVGDNAFCIVMGHALPRYWGTPAPVFAAPPSVDIPAARAGLSARWLGAEGVTARTGRTLAKAALLRRASMLVYGGGSVFREMGPLSEKRLYSLWSRTTGRPHAAVGVSIGPFVSAASQRRLAAALRSMRYVAVRDAASVSRLRQLGFPGTVVAAGDLAGLLPEAFGEDLTVRSAAPAARARLGVSLVGWDGEATGDESNRRLEAIVEAIGSFVRHESVDVTIFVFNTHPRFGDRAVSARLQSALDGHCDVRVVDGTRGVRPVWDEIKKCSIGFHMRMHAAVFSYLAGVPFGLIPYQRKCDDLLDEIGQPTSRRLNRLPAGAAEITRVLTGMLTDGRPAGLPREEFVHRARRNFTEAPWAVTGA